MADDKLMTLKEIADEIGVRYRTVIDCKNQFYSFFLVKQEGRNVKYPSKYIDLFQLIFALKDEGYISNDIKKILSGRHPDPPEMDGWIERWTDGWMDGLTDGGMDGRMDGWMDGRMDEPTKDPREQINSDDQGNDLETDPDDFLTVQEKIDNKFLEFKAELMTEISTLLDQDLNEKISYEFKTLAGKLENHLSELQAQINGSLTQFYKAIINFQEGLMSLNNRLSALEADLDTGGNDQGIELYELDLEDVQIKSGEVNFSKDYKKHENSKNFKNKNKDYTENNPMTDGQEQGKQNDDPPDHGQDQGEPQIENTARYADIQYVRNSIFEGKPDKAAVIEWIQNEKYLDPGQSYGDLANKLNEAGIPTLRGRDTWGRTVVRGLVVKR